MTARPAAVYCRLSRNRSGELSASVQRQEADCRALAEARCLEVGGVYVDDDVSAFSARRRPAWELMMAAVEAGEFGAIIAYHPDRVYRRVSDLERIIEHVEAAGGVPIITSQGGDYDLSTADGRLHARISGVVARHSSERTAERVRRATQARAEAGRPAGGGSRPFGYTADGLEVVEAEAAQLRAGAEALLAGRSLKAAAAACGINRRALKRLLLSTRCAGLRVHRGQVVGAAAWPAIVSPTDQLRLRAILEGRAAAFRTSGASAGPYEARHLLSGVLRCDVCDAGMIAGYRPGGRRIYTCPAFHVSVDGVQTDDLLAEAVQIVLAEVEAPEPEPGVDVLALEASIADDEAALADLGGRMGRRELPAAFALAAASEIEARMATTRDRIAASGPQLVQAAAPRDLRPDDPIDIRRAALGAVLAEVRVRRRLPGEPPRPDRRLDGSGRLRPVWREAVRRPSPAPPPPA